MAKKTRSKSHSSTGTAPTKPKSSKPKSTKPKSTKSKAAKPKSAKGRSRKAKSPTPGGDAEAQSLTKGERRRLRLLDGGVEIVASDGIEGLTVEALAASAEISNGALYRHFGSMDEALGALQVHALHRVTEAVERSLWSLRESLTGGRTAARTRALVELLATVEMALALRLQDAGAMILLRSMAGDPGRRIREHELNDSSEAAARLLGLIGGLFVNAVEAGALESGDATSRAAIWWSSLLGLLQLEKLESLKPSIDLDGLARSHAETLLIGYGASKASVTTARRKLEDS